MAQKSGFFTSSSGDRKYGSDWLAQYISAIISNGVYTTELTVSGDNGNVSVTVGAGRAWINGYMYSNDSDMSLALSAADGALSRTDLIVLRLDMTNRQITLAVVQGDYGGEAPTLTRTSDIYELCLAQIAVAAGTTEITAQIITDTRADETVCGIVAGAVTQLSTGELLEQLKAGFEEWFEGIKGQLSEDAAGNLQNQINDCVKSDDKATDEEAIAGTDDTKWMTPAKTKAAIGKLGDIGSVFMKATGYSKVLSDCLPCTGGAYNPTAYPDLFDTIGYSNGALINAESYVSKAVVAAAVDPTNGDMYVGTVDASSYPAISVYDKDGNLLRTATLYASTSYAVNAIAVYNGKAVATVYGSAYTRGSVSTDGGIAWSTIYSFGNAYSFRGVAVCDTFAAVALSEGSVWYYPFSTSTWTKKSSVSDSYISIQSGSADVIYILTNNAYLLMMDSSGTLTSTTGSNAYALFGYTAKSRDCLYYLNYAGTEVVRNNITTGVMDTIYDFGSARTSFGFRGAIHRDAYDIVLFYDIYSSVTTYHCLLVFPDGTKVELDTNMTMSAVKNADVLDSDDYILFALSTTLNKSEISADMVEFKVPSIAVTGADAYIVSE